MHRVGSQSQTRRDEWAPSFEGTVEGKNGRGLLSKYLFVLKGDKLYFAKNVNVGLCFLADEQVPPHGVIDLSQCQTVKGADDQTHKK